MSQTDFDEIHYKSLEKTGDRGGIRTHDHLIKSQVLYRLSYAVIRGVRALNGWKIWIFGADVKQLIIKL